MAQEFIYPYSTQYITRLNNIAKQRNNQIINQQKDILNNRVSGSFSVPIKAGKLLLSLLFLFFLFFWCLLLSLLLLEKLNSYYNIPTKKQLENHENKEKNKNMKKRSDSPSITSRGSIFSSTSSVRSSTSTSASISSSSLMLNKEKSHLLNHSASSSVTTVKRSHSVDHLKRQKHSRQELTRPVLEQPITMYDGKYLNKKKYSLSFLTFLFVIIQN